MDIKIATLNLCLGLKNKRCELERLMIGNNIDILCLQEVEIKKDYDYHALNLNNYCLKKTSVRQGNVEIVKEQ